MGRKGVDCGCGAREDIYDRLAALRQRIEVLETEINQVESEFPGVLRDVRSAEASAVSAAESASASAEIVTSYDNRLGAVEQGIIDVNDYAEAIGDDVAAIDTEIHTTRPYVTTNTEQTITAKKHIPTATANDSSDVWVNKAFVQATDGRNNLVHNIGDEEIYGSKKYTGAIQSKRTYVDLTTLPTNTENIGYAINQVDIHNTQIFNIWAQRLPSGKIKVYLGVRNLNGQQKNTLLAESDD